MRISTLVLASVAVALAMSGCAVDDSGRAADGDGGTKVRTTGGREGPSVGVRRATSVEGRPIEARIVGTGAQTVLLIGVIHGNEAIGSGLIARLLEDIDLDPSLAEGLRIVAVPVANPDGYAKGTRTNARNVDLNRNFPAANFVASDRRGAEPVSEPESRFLADLILEEKPVRILSIHQPLQCVNYDGPAADLAARMAEANTYEVKADIGYATPGSLGSWAGRDLGIPIVTLETGRSGDVSTSYLRHREALLVFLRGS